MHFKIILCSKKSLLALKRHMHTAQSHWQKIYSTCSIEMYEQLAGPLCLAPFCYFIFLLES